MKALFIISSLAFSLSTFAQLQSFDCHSLELEQYLIEVDLEENFGHVFKVSADGSLGAGAAATKGVVKSEVPGTSAYFIDGFIAAGVESETLFSIGFMPGEESLPATYHSPLSNTMVNLLCVRR